MKSMTYVGPHESVTVDLPEGGTITARNGAEVEVPDELAEELGSRTSWRPVKGADKSTARKAQTTKKES